MCGRMQEGDKVQLLQQGVQKLSSQICHHQSVSLSSGYKIQFLKRTCLQGLTLLML